VRGPRHDLLLILKEGHLPASKVRLETGRHTE